VNKGNEKGRRERACRPEMSPAGDVGGGFPRWIDNLRVLPPGLLVVVVPTPCHTYKHPPPCEGGISRWHVWRWVDRCTGGRAVVSSSGRGTIRAGPLLAGPVPTKRPEGVLSKALREGMEDVHRSSPPASIQEATLAPVRVLSYLDHSM